MGTNSNVYNSNPIVIYGFKDPSNILYETESLFLHHEYIAWYYFYRTVILVTEDWIKIFHNVELSSRFIVDNRRTRLDINYNYSNQKYEDM